MKPANKFAVAVALIHLAAFGNDRRQGENQDNLPDYLREEVDLPLVPIDAVPIQP